MTLELTCVFDYGDGKTPDLCGAPAPHHFLVPISGEWEAVLSCTAHAPAIRAYADDEHPTEPSCNAAPYGRWRKRPPQESFCYDPGEEQAIQEAVRPSTHLLEEAHT